MQDPPRLVLTLGDPELNEDEPRDQGPANIVTGNSVAFRHAVETFGSVAHSVAQLAQKATEPVRRMVKEYEQETAWVNSLPPWERARYEHMTMRQIREHMHRAMRRDFRPRRIGRVRAREHRPTTRRTASSSRTSGADPGEPEPAAHPFGHRDEAVVV
jgi:hypothetical protein